VPPRISRRGTAHQPLPSPTSPSLRDTTVARPCGDRRLSHEGFQQSGPTGTDP
jgi:hypothetical protein